VTWLHRYETTERGDVLSKIADNLNALEKNQGFKVTQRSVRDRYSHMHWKIFEIPLMLSVKTMLGN